MPAQDSGLLDQNIQLIRALFVPPLSSHLMTFFIVKDLGYTCSALSSSYAVFPEQFHPKTSFFFYLATNGIWKSAAATYLHVCQALREPFVRSFFRGE